MPTHSILLTGASGLLGHYVLAELVRKRSARCRAILSPPFDQSRARLAGLLAELKIEIDDALRDGLLQLVAGRLPEQLEPDHLRGCDRILHLAASTDFHASPDGEPFRTNVNGTRALLRASRSAGVRGFMLVSTAYVGGLRDARVAEVVPDSPHPDANDYEKSKWLAEREAVESAVGGPELLICRPSILIGDQSIGRTTHFGGAYILARAVELLSRAVEDDAELHRHDVPLRIMGSASATLNIAPVCWTARHVANLALQDGWSCRVTNLVNPAPPTCGQVKQWLESFFDLRGGSFTDQRWPWQNPSRCEEAFYAAGEFVHAYFRRSVEFETRYLDSIGEHDPLTNESHFHRCIDFARKRDWGRRKPAARTSRPIVDPAWYFEDFMVHRLPHSRLTRLHTFTAVVRYVIRNRPQADWTCTYQGGRLVSIDRTPPTANAQFGFSIDSDAFDRVVRGQQSLQASYFAGQAEMFGDVLQAAKMVPVIDTFLKQFPVPEHGKSTA